MTKAWSKKDGIVHNAEHRFSRLPGFLVDELDNSTFKYVLPSGIVPFPFIKKMGDRGTVAGAVFFKINGLAMISERKDGYEYGHDMFDGRLWKERAQT